MFGRKLLKAVEKERGRESPGREHKGRERGREVREGELSVVGLHPV